MALLFVLALFISVWKRAIAISDELRPKTWKVLTLCSLTLLIVSLCSGVLLRESRVITNQPTNSTHPSTELVKTSSPLNLINFQQGATPDTHSGASVQVHGSRDRAFNFSLSTEFSSGRAQAGSLNLALPSFRRFFESTPIRIEQVTSPEHSGFKKDLLFWVTIFGMVVSPISTVATILLTWISLHRRRAEELLMRLELEKRKLEIEQLRLELEMARLEADNQKSRLIVVAG